MGKSGKVVFPIQGMTCASCVNKVEKALSSLKGVVHANVNFATERASVEYILKRCRSGSQEVVEEAGYQVLEVKKRILLKKKGLPGSGTP